jgi:hypothetical protein
MTIGNLFLGIVAIAIILTVHVYLRPYILRHRALKGPLMPDPDDIAKAPTNRIERPYRRGPTPWGDSMARESDVMPAPAEHSINDVQDTRVQDNNLAVLASQYEGMIQPPWKLETAHQGTPAPKVQLRFLTIALSLQMTPMSAVGSNRSVGLYGDLYYLDVGSNKVWAEEKLCKSIHQELLKDCAAITAENRKTLLASIAALAAAKGNPIAVDPAIPDFVACGQTKIYILDRDKRAATLAQLNTSYYRIIQPALDALCAEIVKRAEG